MTSTKKCIILFLEVILAFAVLFFLAASRYLKDYQIAYFELIAISCAITLIPLVFFLMAPKGKRDITKLIYVLAITYLLNYPIRAAFLIIEKRGLINLFGNVPYFNEALMIFIIGMCSLLFSYYIFPSKSKEFDFLSKEWGRNRFWLVLIFVYLLYILSAISLFVSTYFFTSSTYKSASAVLFESIVPAVILLFLLNHYYFKKSLAYLWLAVFPVQIALSVLMSMKEYLLMPMIYLFIVDTMVKRKINFRIIIAGVLLFFLAFFLITGIRAYQTDNFNELDSPEELAFESVKYPINRMHALDSLAVIVKMTPEEKAFKNGETLLLIPYSFIPRFIWKDKPIIPLGRYFAQNYLDNKNISIGVSNIGDLYWNFGVSSVILGMIVIGLLLRLGSILLEGRPTPVKIILRSILVYYIVIRFVLDSIAANFSGLVRVMMFSLVIVSILNYGGKKR